MKDIHKQIGLVGLGVAAVFTLTSCYGDPYAEFSPKACVLDENSIPIEDGECIVVEPYPSEDGVQ